MPKNLPSIEALQSPDDSRLEEELECVEARRQAAIVRTIADAMTRVDSPELLQRLREQLAEEVERLAPQSEVRLARRTDAAASA